MMTRSRLLKTGFPFLAVSILALMPYGISYAQSAAATEIRVQELEEEIRRLTGKVEEQSFEIRRLKEELQTVTGDMQLRLQALEGGSGSPVASASSPAYGESIYAGEEPASGLQGQPADWEEGVPAQSPVERDDDFVYSSQSGQQQLGTITQPSGATEASIPQSGPATEYERAFALIKTRQYDQAEKSFEAFMNSYPDSELIPNAKYWYGETFYVRGNFERAARVFAEGYKNYPNDSKASGNLLKLGMSLAGLGKADDACVAFKQLKKDYANTAANVLNRADTEMEKINCR